MSNKIQSKKENAEDQALSSGSRDARSLFQLAETHAKNKTYETAIPVYLQAHRLEPKNVEIMSHLGVAYYKLADYARALRCFTTALRVPPKEATVFSPSPVYPTIFASIGLIMDAQQKHQKAIVAYEKAIKLGHPHKEKLERRVTALKAMLEAKPSFSYSLSLGIGDKKPTKKKSE